MITTVIFDLSETYINSLFSSPVKLEPILGKPAAQIYSEMQGGDLISFLKGEITEGEYWSRIIRNSRWKTNITTLKRVLRENFREIEGTREMIEGLKAKGLRLGLLSIHGREWIGYCQGRFNFHKLFDSVEYSFEAGILKPDERSYRRILEKLKAKPEECVFIDDNPENLPPAEALGMKTILFKDPKQLRASLSALGIKL
jgi:HAD superfamily hydrolase (TIGR01509 family)